MGANAAGHPTDRTLRTYGRGELDDASLRAVRKHLEVCGSCQRRIAELSTDGSPGRPKREPLAPRASAAVGSKSVASSAEGCPSSIVGAAVESLPPELIDHPDYDVVRELGRGGMGVVYLAHNRLMGRPEVLKVVGRHLVERPGVLDRFLREIRSAAKLQHANIVAAYSAMRLGQNLVLAMEYVDGLDLAERVKGQGPLAVTHACYCIHQAALGLQHAHERGMVHRDIKPANLILAREGKKGVVKILDFGLAKVTSEDQGDSSLTREGQMLGTPDFIAPEQIRAAQSADIRADIYSLGCTFYYLLTGGPPFRGETLWDVYQAHFSMDAGPLDLVRPEISVELAALVAKMMAKDPDQRFATPGAVAQALTPFLRTTGPGAGVPVSRESQGGYAAGAVPARPASAPSGSAGLRAEPPGAQPEPAWDSLIAVQHAESLRAPARLLTESPVRSRSGHWRTVVAASGVLMVGFGIAAVVGIGPPKNGGVAPKAIASLVAEPERQRVEPEDGVASAGTGKDHATERRTAAVSSRPLSQPAESGVPAPPGTGGFASRLAPLERDRQSQVKKEPSPPRAVAPEPKYDPAKSRPAPPVGELALATADRAGKEARRLPQSVTPAPRGKAGHPKAKGRPAPRIVSSWFSEGDTDGWYTLDEDGLPNATKGFRVDSNQGNSWLVAVDNPNDKMWGWQAPEKYLGNHSEKFGRLLTYRIWTDKSNLPATDVYVRLIGGGKVIFLDGTTLGRPVAKVWKTYTIRLDASAGWKRATPRGTPVKATDNDIKQVLSGLIDFRN